jgi:hypothetical protein
MSKKLKQKFGNCPPDKYFKAKDGQVIRHLLALPAAIKQMDEETFRHHVNENRNDFLSWINNVFCQKSACPPSQAFVTKRGERLHSIKQLEGAIEKMNVKTFKHHVNSKKNDFASWTGDVLGDSKLAAQLQKIKSKAATLRALRQQ